MATSYVLLVSVVILSLAFSLSSTHNPAFSASVVSSPNPFTAKEALLRYWSRKIPAGTRRPEFLVSKLSPLSALDYATYSSLAANDRTALSARLIPFCAAAHLHCTSSGMDEEKKRVPSNILAFIYSNTTAMSDFASATGADIHKFIFRERSLQPGAVMPMPDITDKMPGRSFLPRSIAENIPFSAEDVLRLFQISPNGCMGKGVPQTVADCHLQPSRGESKKCVTSAEDMLDFVSSKVGSGAVARSTEGDRSSHGDVVIGEVRGNKHTLVSAVTCHQMMFPYLVYYCHTVPGVRIYEADILDVQSKKKIGNGVVMCHVDTSYWSPDHVAFAVLGSEPGKTEVCHWIEQGDLTWTAY